MHEPYQLFDICLMVAYSYNRSSQWPNGQMVYMHVEDIGFLIMAIITTTTYFLGFSRYYSERSLKNK